MSVDHELEVLSYDAAMAFTGSAELFVEISEMLLEELPEQMDLIHQHAGAGDLKALSKTAHRLKGNFAVVAAQQAQAVAKELEHSARGGDATAAQAAVIALDEAVARFVPVLERHIAEAAV